MADPCARTVRAMDDTAIDVRLTVIEYAEIARGYEAAVSAPDAPPSATEDYAVVMDVLALVHGLPDPDVPPVLAVGARALRRVHLALLGTPPQRQEP
ncbi:MULTISPECIES: hypothetical protein [unclassified Streptomyces]|uniref:hypothetical protein n=1 Tax=unclassified Streptomyces TaxID=2593676 RepID=UPI0033D1E8CD